MTGLCTMTASHPFSQYSPAYRKHPSHPISYSPSRISSSFFCVQLLLFLLLSSLPASHSATSHFASSLTFQIEARQEECVYEDIQMNTPFQLEFEVTRGGLLDIRLRVSDPNGLIVIERMAYFNRADEAMNEAEGRVSWTATMTGRYAICFDNTMSRWTAKVVSLFIPNTNPQAAADRALSDSAAKLQDLGGMVDSIIKIADQLDEIEKLQHHQRVREQQWRDEGEANDSNVQWLTLVEGLLLIGLTVGELQYIRNWFKETGKMGRV